MGSRELTPLHSVSRSVSPVATTNTKRKYASKEDMQQQQRERNRIHAQRARARKKHDLASLQVSNSAYRITIYCVTTMRFRKRG
jgi:hypothetical protein